MTEADTDTSTYCSNNTKEHQVFLHFSTFDYIAIRITCKQRAQILRHLASDTLFMQPPTIVATATLASPFQLFSPCNTGTLRILNTPNAGGDSVLSEAVAFDLLYRLFGMQLQFDEMHVPYVFKGGPMVDFVCAVNGQWVGVSVTRVFYGAPEIIDANSGSVNGKKDGAKRDLKKLTREGVERLLWKKVNGLYFAARGVDVADGGECKKVLLVWVRSGKVARMVRKALGRVFKAMDEEVKEGVVVLVVVTDLKGVFERSVKVDKTEMEEEDEVVMVVETNEAAGVEVDETTWAPAEQSFAQPDAETVYPHMQPIKFGRGSARPARIWLDSFPFNTCSRSSTLKSATRLSRLSHMRNHKSPRYMPYKSFGRHSLALHKQELGGGKDERGCKGRVGLDERFEVLDAHIDGKEEFTIDI